MNETLGGTRRHLLLAHFEPGDGGTREGGAIDANRELHVTRCNWCRERRQNPRRRDVVFMGRGSAPGALIGGYGGEVAHDCVLEVLGRGQT